MVTLNDFINMVWRLAPITNAAPDDPIGIQVGHEDPSYLNSVSIKRVTIALAPTAETIVKSGSTKTNLLLTHLPLSTQPTYSLTDERYNVVKHLIKMGIFLFSVHTSWDGAEHGTNETLAEVLGLETQTLLPSSQDPRSANVGRIASPKRPTTLQTLVRTTAEKLKDTHVTHVGPPTAEVKSVGIFAGHSLTLDNIREARNRKVDTLIACGGTPPVFYAAHQLKINLILASYKGTVTPGMRRLRQLLQLDASKLDIDFLEIPSPLKAMYFL
ncbi:MAG: Nif3-like dinuclear metal center hexameric protein [Candidatus Ranarchaeia archaeon]|jgi:putative NIF3 family GTP cyclohydrolase 1 type 2